VAFEGAWTQDEIYRLQNAATARFESTPGAVDPLYGWDAPAFPYSCFLGEVGQARSGEIVLSLGDRTIRLTAAVAPPRVTCLGVVLHRDGGIRLNQSLLLPPGVADPRLDGSRFAPPPSKAAQLISLAVELLRDARTLTQDQIAHLELTKWIDPVMGIIGFMARTGLLEDPRREVDFNDFSNAGEVADNLTTYFADLVDVRLITAIKAGDIEVWRRLLDSRPQPILAASLRILAVRAAELGLDATPYLQRLRGIDPSQLWNATYALTEARAGTAYASATP
jgi:hypothetical protein